MSDFEMLLDEHRKPVERFVKYRISSDFDAEDILQEIFLAAYTNFDKLADRSNFKVWILGIARHKCNDYYRKKGQKAEVSMDEMGEPACICGRTGLTKSNPVRDTILLLSKKDREILYLSYYHELPQSKIAEMLKIPVGTVKSRLYAAKKHFREKYPYPPETKGVNINMLNKLPFTMPEYRIIPTDQKPFSVKWEEFWGLFIVPKPGEKVQWGSYDAAAHTLCECSSLEVTTRAEIHGVPGVEIRETRKDESGKSQTFRYIVQLTDTHCRMLAEEYEREGVRKTLTFLDGDDFLEDWGYGDNNSGKETNIAPKGMIRVNEDGLCAENTNQLFDIVGRYTIRIGGAVYDTVRLVCLDSYQGESVMTEHYLDQNGRTVLWRRFNRDDWKIKAHGNKKWSELLPENEIIRIDGQNYVHWYDCITDYIL